jgi:uncharacterized protein (TIGR03437 family)
MIGMDARVYKGSVDKSGGYWIGSAQGAFVRMVVDISKLERVWGIPSGTRPIGNWGHDDKGYGIACGIANDNIYRKYDLSDPNMVQNSIALQPKRPNWSQSMHGSLRGPDDWFLVSTYSYGRWTHTAGPYHDEIYLLRTDGSGDVQRVAHHHCYPFRYWASPRAVLSMDGRLAAWTSNWHSSGRTDVFIALVLAGGKPTFKASRVLNAASFENNIAPGGLVTIIGENLANCTASNNGSPPPSTLCNASVTFNGQGGLLFFASPSQVNILMPGSVAPRQDVQVIVDRLGTTSDPVIVPASAVDVAAPAIFSYLSNQRMWAIILNSDNSLNRLQAGESSALYANALGPVNPSVPEDQPAPANPLSRTVLPIEVWINNVPQPVSFAGLAAGQFGVYQVNFTLDPQTPIQTTDDNYILLKAGPITGPAVLISLAAG